MPSIPQCSAGFQFQLCFQFCFLLMCSPGDSSSTGFLPPEMPPEVPVSARPSLSTCKQLSCEPADEGILFLFPYLLINKAKV